VGLSFSKTALKLRQTTAVLILAALLSLPLFSERASADAIPGQFVLVVELTEHDFLPWAYGAQALRGCSRDKLLLFQLAAHGLGGTS
jgi:hypothetical protein